MNDTNEPSALPTRTAKYKGRDYLLKWTGETKHGHRTLLMFTDGSKEFWVDSKLVRETTGKGPAKAKEADAKDGSPSGCCPMCGRPYDSHDDDIAF